MLTPEALAVAAVLFLAATARSFFGFGDAAVAMPLLALLGVRLETAVPLVGAAGLLGALVALIGGTGRVDVEDLQRLSVSTAVGIPFGVLLVSSAPEHLVVRTLGILLLAYGIYSLVGPTVLAVRRPQWALVFGFLAGSLGSAYNLNGMPVAVFGVMRRWPPDLFRGTLQAHFVVSSILVVLGQGIGGLWTAEVVNLMAVAVPAVLFAVPLGQVLHRRGKGERFASLVYGLIGLLGLLLIV